MLYLFTNKESINILKNYIDLLTFFQFLAKFTESFLKNFLIKSIKINFLQNANLVFSIFLQLWSIVHEINSSFDYDPTTDVSGVFLDISKAFDKVWHAGILFKLKTYDVNGKVFTLLTKYLHVRYKSSTEWTNFFMGTC